MLAQTDITGVVTSLSAYETTAVAIGVAVLLYSIGRRIVKEATRGDSLPASSWGEELGIDANRSPDYEFYSPQGEWDPQDTHD